MVPKNLGVRHPCRPSSHTRQRQAAPHTSDRQRRRGNSHHWLGHWPGCSWDTSLDRDSRSRSTQGCCPSSTVSSAVSSGPQGREAERNRLPWAACCTTSEQASIRVALTYSEYPRGYHLLRRRFDPVARDSNETQCGCLQS
jgi:hypothetical protein